MALTVDEHRCRVLDKIDTIGVEKVQMPGNKPAKWYLRFYTVLNEVIYCPYCGAKLEKEAGAGE
ncbi:hypothetical protein SPSPH_045540 [Sporomusa sphaeroides DSM 2875]|uniref:Zinc finger CHCC-type domain-containing protein n=1 Tax=Sporomusa sphaeroides DSM 2875 TaxID=1337886 RepID=A0ABM9W002_9FIRM|nr:hypothetical protein SPSPH_27800 [Sporomusa sphaeroides DSM 2875]CVK18482.1 hypothetical protein SSPH_01120 [Sporomusa sphaeroides DSM 2875]